ncbi:MAG: cache domain-containing protein [Candidatus Cloacimonadota bacterium]|nr:cache domain-containing protein [Candidatus Cloacimonadota bacterium]
MQKVKTTKTYKAKSSKSILGIFLILFLFLSVSCEKNPPKKSNGSLDQLSQYKYEQTKKIVQLVNDAVKLVENEGKKAFPKFRKKGSKWYNGNTYIFVWGLDGMRYVYPRNPEGEGKNMLALKDVQDRPIGEMITKAAKTENGEGWVFYEWTKPEHEEPVWKATFVKKAIAPTGKKYLIGCGEYNIKMEKEFIVQIVTKAASLFQNDRKSAMKAFTSPIVKPSFQNTYIFVKDIKGNEILNPFSPEIVNKNIMNIQDANGKYFVKEEIEILKNNDTCWMDYYWNKPKENEPSPKLSFLKRVIVDGDTLIIGSGFYPEK